MLPFWSDFKGFLLIFYYLKALELKEFCKLEPTEFDFFFFFKFPDFS